MNKNMKKWSVDFETLNEKTGSKLSFTLEYDLPTELAETANQIEKYEMDSRAGHFGNELKILSIKAKEIDSSMKG